MIYDCGLEWRSASVGRRESKKRSKCS